MKRGISPSPGREKDPSLAFAAGGRTCCSSAKRESHGQIPGRKHPIAYPSYEAANVDSPLEWVSGNEKSPSHHEYLIQEAKRNLCEELGGVHDEEFASVHRQALLSVNLKRGWKAQGVGTFSVDLSVVVNR